MPLYNAELSSNLFQHQFAERVSMITSMAKQSEEGLNDFLQVINSDFKDLFIHISEMQMNLKVLRSEIEYHKEQNAREAIKRGISAGEGEDNLEFDIHSSIHNAGKVVSIENDLHLDEEE